MYEGHLFVVAVAVLTVSVSVSVHESEFVHFLAFAPEFGPLMFIMGGLVCEQ